LAKGSAHAVAWFFLKLQLPRWYFHFCCLEFEPACDGSSEARETFKALDEVGLRVPLEISHGKIGDDTCALMS